MILKLMKVTETLIENKKCFVSEYVLDTSLDANKEYIATVLQVVTSERPKNSDIGACYNFKRIPLISLLPVKEKKAVTEEGKE